MKLQWAKSGFADLRKVATFLEAGSPRAAARVVETLSRAPKRLLDHPRIGIRLEEFDPREVRRLIVGDYEIRYELSDDTIRILNIFHVLEDR